MSPSDGYPFQRICLDFVGPLPLTRRGNEYILTIRDSFTRWLEAIPLRRANSETVARILEKEVFCRYGFPDSIHSDQGSQFTSQFFHELTQALGIRATTTPAYNPKSNPVERAHRDLGNILRGCQSRAELHWEEALPEAVVVVVVVVREGRLFRGSAQPRPFREGTLCLHPTSDSPCSRCCCLNTRHRKDLAGAEAASVPPTRC